MKCDILEFNEYIKLLEEFSNAKYSKNKILLSYMYELLDNNEYEKFIENNPHLTNYFKLGLANNYKISFYGKKTLYNSLVSDFKKKKIGGFKWEFINDIIYPYDCKVSFFASTKLKMSIQISNSSIIIQESTNPKEILKLNNKTEVAKIEFPSLHKDLKCCSNLTKFNYFRDIANTVFSFSKYIKKKKIPIHIYLNDNFHSFREEFLSINYNPFNQKITYIPYKKE